MRRNVASKRFVTVTILAFLFIFIHHASAQSAPDETAPSTLIITEIYPNTEMQNEVDEYLAITNPGVHPVNIGSWSITDREGTIIFPPFEVHQNQTIYVTRTASAFLEQMRSIGKDIYPDFEYGSDSDPQVSQMQPKEKTLAFRNTGDEVILQDKSGREIDVVIYGNCSYEGTDWCGTPLESPREGMVLRRKGTQDTNQCEDWLNLPYGTSYHTPERIGISGTAIAFVSPDCSFSVLQREIEHASSSLYINLYQFENLYLMDSIMNVLNRRAEVFLLLEGSPVGGITDEERYIARMITERGGAVRLSNDPFINHAKYAVVDNETLIVMTENWGSTGVPLNNSFGNRGWGIVIQNERIANYFKGVFLEDFYCGKDFAFEMEDFKPNGFPTNWMIPKGAYVPIFEPRTATCSFSVIPVLAPDNAVSNETIMGVINNGTERILVQQFSTGRFWGEDANPFITALIDAARRGCEVKVLLDSNDYNLDAWNDNDEAIKWMNGVANEEHLNLEANLADLDALGLTKLHTKGLIVDGKVVVIASLNWNANSIYNREAGIIVENEELASYYEAVFFHDWNASVKRELAGYRENGSEERSATEKPLKIKVLGIAVTIILSFIIFRIVRWYKRT